MRKEVQRNSGKGLMGVKSEGVKDDGKEGKDSLKQNSLRDGFYAIFLLIRSTETYKINE